MKNTRTSEDQIKKSEGQGIRGKEEDSFMMAEYDFSQGERGKYAARYFNEKPVEWKNITPSHEKLWIWQKANRLYLEIIKISSRLPRHELYNLKSQIERSSKSVKDNIAEGNESYYYNDKKKGFFIARKEAAETQNHVREMEHKLYIPKNVSQQWIDEYEEIKRGMNGMIRRIEEKADISKKKGARHL